MSDKTPPALVPTDDCNCPLIVGSHRYGDGCMTACPVCESIPKCEHDEDEWLDQLRADALQNAVNGGFSG